MNNNISILKNLFILVISVSFAACQKYIDIKPNETYYTIKTLSDLRNLLDNTAVMNNAYSNTQEIASDNFFLLSNDWSSLASLTHKNVYIWDNDVYNESKNNDWFYIYRSILYANIVLENFNKFDDNSNEAKEIKSAALFYRAWSLFQAIQIWTAPYEATLAKQLPGIPLKTNSDFNAVSSRSTMENSYNFLINDINEALKYLPLSVAYKTRPSKAAGYGLLSRVYLSRNEYEKAGSYADSALQINSALLNYNTLSASSNTPIPRFNSEVIFHATSVNALILNNPRGKVDTALYSSYNNNDLRKRIFFRAASGYQAFKGSYDGSTALFSGLANDEMYLTKAETLARTGHIENAIGLLNMLLEKRFVTGTYIPLVPTNNSDVLELILSERRKELLFRHSRWMDLRRLNQEEIHRVTIKRELGDQTYTLLPGSSKYTFKIPEFVIQNSEVIQNP